MSFEVLPEKHATVTLQPKAPTRWEKGAYQIPDVLVHHPWDQVLTPHPLVGLEASVLALLHYVVHTTDDVVDITEWCPEAFNDEYTHLIGPHFMVFRLPKGALHVLAPFVSLVRSSHKSRMKPTRLNSHIGLLRFMLGLTTADLVLRAVEKGIQWFMTSFYLTERGQRAARLKCLNKNLSVRLSRDERVTTDGGPSVQVANQSVHQPWHWDGIGVTTSLALMLTEAPATGFAKAHSIDVQDLVRSADTPEKLGAAYLTLLQEMVHRTTDVTSRGVVCDGTGFLFDAGVNIHAGSGAHVGGSRVALYAEVVPHDRITRIESADVVLSMDTLAVAEATEMLPQLVGKWRTGVQGAWAASEMRAFVKNEQVRRKLTVFAQQAQIVQGLKHLPKVRFGNVHVAALDYDDELGY
jgi:hypothetical protein